MSTSLNAISLTGRIGVGNYILEITPIDGGYRLTTKRGKDVQTIDIMNGIGIESIEKLGSTGNVDNYRITLSDGSTFDYSIETNEADRAAAELERINAEAARVSAEQMRVTAETDRANAETGRAEAFAGYETEIDQFKTEIVTSKDTATENTRFAIGKAEESLEVPSMEEFNELKGDLSEKVGMEERTVNIFNGTFESGYISNGSVIADASLYHVTISDVIGDIVYKSNPDWLGLSAAKVFVYNKDGSYVGEITATELDSSGIYTAYIDKKYDIKINVGVAKDTNTFMVVRGCTLDVFPTKYEPYKEGVKIEENVYLNKTQTKEVMFFFNPLYGKKIAVTGDSICYGNGYTGGYAKMIADNNNMTMQNIAIGGGTIVPQDGRFDISASVVSLDEDSDYIILEGGVNDSSISSINLGEFSNSFDLPSSRDTFYKCLDYMFYNLTHRFSGKKYGFVIVHQMTRKLGAMFGDEATFYNAIIKSCKKWGVPVCDLNVNCPPFGLLSSSDALRVTYTTSNDGWHPNEEGYKKYYVPKIESWLKSL